MNHNDSWKASWRPMMGAVGRDFADGPPVFAADPIERSTIRRWLEPLEFDCALHYDPEVARAHGHADVTLPTSALPTFTLSPMWRPGERLFSEAGRNAQPARSPVTGFLCGLEPPTTGFFATEVNIDYLRTAVTGDRLARRGRTLATCLPKATRVGRGAFITWESEILNQRLEVVARLRNTYFRYNPHTSEP